MLRAPSPIRRTADGRLAKSDMPTGRGFLSGAASNGVQYAIGGLAIPNVLKTNQAYNP